MDDDLYFVDTRNADPRDHRVVRPGAIVPARPVTIAPMGTTARVAYAPPPGMVYPGYPSAAVYGATAPVYASPPPGYGAGWAAPLGGLFGIGLGGLVKLGLDALAVFNSLPAAPVPTGDVATDVANTDVHITELFKDLNKREMFKWAGEVADLVTSATGPGRFGAW